MNNIIFDIVLVKARTKKTCSGNFEQLPVTSNNIPGTSMSFLTVAKQNIKKNKVTLVFLRLPHMPLCTCS